MKHTATFSADSGQYAGTHEFETLKARDAFMKRAAARGVDISSATLSSKATVPAIKTRLGIPTRKEIDRLCERHGLQTFDRAQYARFRYINWGHPHNANNRAADKVADELRAAGFVLSMRYYSPVTGVTGQILIVPKASAS